MESNDDLIGDESKNHDIHVHVINKNESSGFLAGNSQAIDETNNINSQATLGISSNNLRND